MDLERNLSTEHQRPGDAKRPDDALLDKPRTPDAAAGRGGLSEVPDAGNGGEDRLHQDVANQGHPVAPEDYPEPNAMPPGGSDRADDRR
jgi:hypothetical protein